VFFFLIISLPTSSKKYKIYVEMEININKSTGVFCFVLIFLLARNCLLKVPKNRWSNKHTCLRTNTIFFFPWPLYILSTNHHLLSQISFNFFQQHFHTLYCLRYVTSFVPNFIIYHLFLYHASFLSFMSWPFFRVDSYFQWSMQMFSFYCHLLL